MLCHQVGQFCLVLRQKLFQFFCLGLPVRQLAVLLFQAGFFFFDSNQGAGTHTLLLVKAGSQFIHHLQFLQVSLPFLVGGFDLRSGIHEVFKAGFFGLQVSQFRFKLAHLGFLLLFLVLPLFRLFPLLLQDSSLFAQGVDQSFHSLALAGGGCQFFFQLFELFQAGCFFIQFSPDLIHAGSNRIEGHFPGFAFFSCPGSVFLPDLKPEDIAQNSFPFCRLLLCKLVGFAL